MSLPLLLLTDARFPAGGYAHSGGLEAAVEDGLAATEVPAYVAGRLRGVSGPESVLAVLAARAARAADLGRLLALDAEAQARCPSPPLRVAAGRLGSQLLRTGAEVWPADATIARYRVESVDTPRPVAFGVVAAAGGLGDADVARAYLYEDASGVLAAAVRLVTIDSAQTARRLLELEPLIARLAADASAASDDASEAPGGFAPALERRSLDHAKREGRLFAT